MILEKTAVHWRYNKDAKRYTISDVPISDVPISDVPVPDVSVPDARVSGAPYPQFQARDNESRGLQRKWHHNPGTPAGSCAGGSAGCIIRVTLTTICSSDIHIKHGAVPRAVPGTILGHEFVGIVEQTGEAVKSLNRETVLP